MQLHVAKAFSGPSDGSASDAHLITVADLVCWSLYGQCLSYFPIAVIKYPNESFLGVEGVFCFTVSEGYQPIKAAGREGVVTEAGGWPVTLHLHWESRVN